MQLSVLDAPSWAQQQFGECQLGDVRRTRRLVGFAAQAAQHPSGSVPQMTASWGDAKAAYRLISSPKATFAALATPHWQQTRQAARGVCLLIDDTTYVDFGIRRKQAVSDLTHIGDGLGWGFLLHSALAVDAASERVLGLTGQTIHYRQRAPKKENKSQRLRRARESQVWGQVVDQTGSPPEGAQWVHLMDRGGDNFEVYCHLRQQQVNWVVRAAQLHRGMYASAELRQKQPLSQILRSFSLAGTYQLQLRARGQQKARIAQIEVRFGRVWVPPPTHQSAYVKRLAAGPIAMSVVWVREVGARRGMKPLQWVLLTSLEVNTFDDAWQVISYYEKRPLIEDWHKALKSGCHVEERQFKTASRLEAMTGLLSVMAVRLVQLRGEARTNPSRLASEVIPSRWIEALCRLRRQLAPRQSCLTVREFYVELAKLGGFLGRRGDGEPGWITIWRGWEKFQLVLRGYELTKH